MKQLHIITLYHVASGGPATEENGALLKSYNHQWLEQQSVATRERINGMLRRFKLQFVGMEIDSNFRIGNQVQIDFDKLGEFIEIPLFKNEEIEKER